MFATNLWWLKSKLLVKGALKRKDASRECGRDCDTPSFDVFFFFFWSRLKYLLRQASVMTEWKYSRRGKEQKERVFFIVHPASTVSSASSSPLRLNVSATSTSASAQTYGKLIILRAGRRQEGTVSMMDPCGRTNVQDLRLGPTAACRTFQEEKESVGRGGWVRHSRSRERDGCQVR